MNFKNSKLIRSILMKCIYIMHQIFDVGNFIVAFKACVHYFYFCHQNKTFNKLEKILFFISLWYHYIPTLDFENTDSLRSGEAKLWSWCLVNYLSEYYKEKFLAVPRPTLVYHIGRETVSLTQCWSMHFTSYDPLVTQILWLRSQSLAKHIIRVWT